MTEHDFGRCEDGNPRHLGVPVDLPVGLSIDGQTHRQRGKQGMNAICCFFQGRNEQDLTHPARLRPLVRPEKVVQRPGLGGRIGLASASGQLLSISLRLCPDYPRPAATHTLVMEMSIARAASSSLPKASHVALRHLGILDGTGCCHVAAAPHVVRSHSLPGQRLPAWVGGSRATWPDAEQRTEFLPSDPSFRFAAMCIPPMAGCYFFRFAGWWHGLHSSCWLHGAVGAALSDRLHQAFGVVVVVGMH